MHHSVLFWNVARKNLGSAITKLAVDLSPAVIALAENPVRTPDLIRLIAAEGRLSFRQVDSTSRRIDLLVRADGPTVRPIVEAVRGTIVTIEQHGGSYTAAFLHLPSKLHATDTDQQLSARLFADHIRDVERRVGHTRTIVAGDFNMDPFEVGMVAASAFHALKHPAILRHGSRKVGSIRWTAFFNPFWSFLGPGAEGPRGTFFRQGSGDVEHFWHVFDQVLVRPTFAPSVPIAQIKIVTGTNGLPDLSKASGKPNRKLYSDHFPIYYEVTGDGYAHES